MTVLVGAGDDTLVSFGFFPSTLRIRAGDTVVWKLNSDERQVVTFTSEEPPEEFLPVPGGSPGSREFMINPQTTFPSRQPGAPVETYSGKGFVTSGAMSKEALGPPGTPPNDTFAVTFDTPGTYEYGELLKGTIIVEPSNAADIPTQAEIDALAQQELAPIQAVLEELQAAVASGLVMEKESGPDGTDIWLVQAGVGSPEAMALDFVTKDLTIKLGDTVFWTSDFIHTVTFNPGPPPPEFVIPTPQEGGPPLLLVNPEVMFPVKHSAEFDPSQYYNSGLIGFGGELPGGSGFSLTFNQTGTFHYVCVLHRELGMKGTVTVVE